MMRLTGFYGMPLATYEYKPDAIEFLYHGSIVTLQCVCNAHKKRVAD